MKKLTFLVALCLMLAPSVFADSVPYNGGQFSLAVTNLTGNTYQVTYKADFTHWTGGSLFMSGLDFGFGSANVVGAPQVLNGSWTYQGDGALNGGLLGNNGCNTSSNSNFACFESGHYWDYLTAGVYTWTFNVTYDRALTDSMLTADNDHIGGLFVNIFDSSRGILSMGVDVNTPPPPPPPTSVPEPATLTLLAAGAGLLFVKRRIV